MKNFSFSWMCTYQCHQCGSTCQVSVFPGEQQTVSFFLKWDQKFYKFEETQASIQDGIVVVCCPTCRNEKEFTCQLTKTLVSTTVKTLKPSVICLLFNLRIYIFCDSTHCFARKRSRDYNKQKPFPFSKKINGQQHPNLFHRKKSFHLWHKCIDFPLVDTVNEKFIWILILYTFSLP